MHSAQEIAEKASAETGINFTWHLARHAFFNRAYEAVADIQDPTQRQIRLNDLIYWGGWSNEKSLRIYIRRAQRDRAQRALSGWQRSLRASSEAQS
jgi:hypothetical protein